MAARIYLDRASHGIALGEAAALQPEHTIRIPAPRVVVELEEGGLAVPLPRSEKEERHYLSFPGGMEYVRTLNRKRGIEE